MLDARVVVPLLLLLFLLFSGCAPPERFGGGSPLPRAAPETSARLAEPLRPEAGFTWALR